MNHQPVKSSRIASVGYDEKSSTLEIRFYQTYVLQYRGVPAHIYRNFLSVVSKADFMTGLLRKVPGNQKQIMLNCDLCHCTESVIRRYTL